MVELNLTPHLQEKLEQAQKLQGELEVIVAQRYQLEVSLKEVEKSLEELEKVGDDAPIYKHVGSILVRAKSKDEVKKELEEKKEMLELRIKAVQRQQELLQKKYEEIQREFAAAYGGGAVSG
ncbi:prefoldin subunit beta [Candidatus Aciduliprofundum boonei]|uniref:Prefoldin subunit beta n=1 Tax=Aciduliprofundum boonei (strain DSM 19572 / T469) TaxID=439481 RepID=B5IFK5_ACIB4|nr:prefoldin subunit beta [Candidatus Aciduliprofundum boonei]ADD08932.1 prefoldin, beta subunit [Aciduliprofundum boonei T469]EDY34893.1 prefoldin, beta subunit [Aciduliprofundum boonei T469]HII54753.1 prefoldin subunit beta [Candidatus Aciduliprofundum boonei]